MTLFPANCNNIKMNYQKYYEVNKDNINARKRNIILKTKSWLIQNVESKYKNTTMK